MKKSFKKISLIIFLAFFPTLIIAGEGKFNPPLWTNPKTNYQIEKVGTIDINVLLDGSLLGDDWSDINLKNYFERISKEVYDATERQVQFGIVKVYRGSSDGEDKADLVVSPSIGNPFTAGLNVFGNGTLNSIIYANEKHLINNRREFIAHELGHLLFGIGDSYSGYLKDQNDDNKYLQPSQDNKSWVFLTNKEVFNPNHKNFKKHHLGFFCDIFYDPTEWNISDWNNPSYDCAVKSIGCLMEGPWEDETEFSTPAEKGYITDHLEPFKKTLTWSTSFDGSTIVPPLVTPVVVVTRQNMVNNNESAWETIVKNHPEMQIPISEPISNDVGGHILFDQYDDDKIDFIVVPAINQVSICIDRSGSMIGSPLDMAKISAELLVNLSHEEDKINIDDKIINVSGDYLSITAFDDFATMIFSIFGRVVEMNFLNKALAINAIDQLIEGGSTSIGAGLNLSKNTFINDLPVSKSVILLSDGKENAAPFVSEIMPSLIENGIRVYSVGLGTGADTTLLRSISDDTNGEFFFAESEDKLPSIFSILYGNIRNDSIIDFNEGSTIGQKTVLATNNNTVSTENLLQQRTDHSVSVSVDDFVGEATFLFTWNHGEVDVNLKDPNGNLISSSNFSTIPDVEYINGTGYVIYRIPKIDPGDWIVEFITDNALSVDWELKVFAIDGLVNFRAESEKGSYIYPEPVIISASCVVPQPIINGQATADIHRPDGTIVDIVLYDDGDYIKNGDTNINDGIYSAKFSSFSSDGVYTVTAKFDSTGGETPTPSNSPETLFSFIEANDLPILPKQIPYLKRFRQFTFSVSGFPDVIPATVYIHPETLNLKSKGKYITAYIELDNPYDVHNIDTNSILLKGGDYIINEALIKPIAIGDFDSDFNSDLMVKFDRFSVEEFLLLKENNLTEYEFSIEGNLTTGEIFNGSSKIKIVKPKNR